MARLRSDGSRMTDEDRDPALREVPGLALDSDAITETDAR
jgi:hypothetical protein